MPRRPAGPNHPTRLALLDATQQLITAKGASGVAIEDVLALAHASKGSLYHHFSDLGELIETAQLRLYADMVQSDLASLAYLVEDSGSVGELRERIEAAALGTFDPARKEIRQQRAEVVVASIHGSRSLKASLARYTRRIVGELAGVIEVAKQRGFVRVGVDAAATASLLLAMTFGQVFVEVADEDLDPTRSASAYVQLLDGILLGDDAAPPAGPMA